MKLTKKKQTNMCLGKVLGVNITLSHGDTTWTKFTFSRSKRQVILQAIDEWGTKTCLRFVPAEATNKDYTLHKQRIKGRQQRANAPNCTKHYLAAAAKRV